MTRKYIKREVYIKINDIFDDLSEENKRLENELMFANNCLKVLNQFKDYLNKIYVKFETLIDSKDKQQFNQLEDEFNSIIKIKEQTIGSTDEKSIENVTENDNHLNEDLNRENTIKTKEKKTRLLIETNIRRSGRKERILYVIPKPKRDLNSRPQPKPKPKVIPDPEVEPNSLLLLRRNNFDEQTQRYVCPNPFCDKSFDTSRNLYKHFHLVHFSTKKYFCEHFDCKRGFKRKDELKAHLLRHSNSVKQFVCDFKGCDYRTRIRVVLDNHKLIHSDVRSFKCIECEKTFKTKDYLKAHQRRQHSKPTYKCRFNGCNQFFQLPNHLFKHQVICHNHNKRKTYVCDWPGCDYSTPNCYSFKLHSTHHSGDKPYPCDWPGCGKRFRLRSTWKHHMLMHNDLKPITCVWPGCQYRCRITANLKKHLRVHQK